MTHLSRKRFLSGSLKGIVSVGATALSESVARSQTPRRFGQDSPASLKRDLEAIIAEEIALSGIPAVSLSVFGEGLAPINIAVGKRCLGQTAEVTIDDAFQIGSTTKIFTALTFARLHDRKLLNWNATIGDAFGELPEAVHPKFANLTIKHLLSHRSGIARDWTLDPALPPLPGDSTPERRWNFAGHALSAEPIHPSGKYSYSNTAFVCLGALIEKKAGMPWFEVVKREVIEPLGIVGAVAKPPLDAAGKSIVAGHIKGNGGTMIPIQAPYQGRYASDLLDPAGAIWLPIKEFEKLARGIYANRDSAGVFLGQATYRDYLSLPFGGSYGMGLRHEFRGFAGGPALGHNGTYMGFENHFFFSPVKRKGIALNANVVSTVGYPILRGISERCAERLGWQPYRVRGGDVSLGPWVHSAFDGAEGALTILSDGTLRIATTRTGKSIWNNQVWAVSRPLIDGQTYRVIFEAKTDAPRTLSLIAQWESAPHTGVGLDEPRLVLGTEYKKFGFYFTPKGASGKAVKCPAFFVGDSLHTVYIRHVQVQKINF